MKMQSTVVLTLVAALSWGCHHHAKPVVVTPVKPPILISKISIDITGNQLDNVPIGTKLSTIWVITSLHASTNPAPEIPPTGNDGDRSPVRWSAGFPGVDKIHKQWDLSEPFRLDDPSLALTINIEWGTQDLPGNSRWTAGKVVATATTNDVPPRTFRRELHGNNGQPFNFDKRDGLGSIPVVSDFASIWQEVTVRQ